MLNSGVLMEELAVHWVGSNLQDEGVQLSAAPLLLRDPLVHDLLLQYFFSPFKTQEYFHLHHTEAVTENVIHSIATRIFSDQRCFFEQSCALANFLYEKSTHPKSKAGEFYVVYFKDCLLDDELVDAIGVFKSESKDKFLKVFPSGNQFEMEVHEGLALGKLDKGCIIYNTDAASGYRLCLIDQGAKSEAQYWKEEFLQVTTRNDSFHHTQQYMSLCKDFVTEQLPEQFEVSRTDQIDLLNRSASFFKKNDTFDFNEFSREVIQQPELIDSFKNFKKQYSADHEVTIADEFNISDQAVRKQAKVFKSVLKLDKNFHIYIHGNKDMIERGYDEDKGMQYYKVFYKEEA